MNKIITTNIQSLNKDATYDAFDTHTLVEFVPKSDIFLDYEQFVDLASEFINNYRTNGNKLVSIDIIDLYDNYVAYMESCYDDNKNAFFNVENFITLSEIDLFAENIDYSDFPRLDMTQSQFGELVNLILPNIVMTPNTIPLMYHDYKEYLNNLKENDKFVDILKIPKNCKLVDCVKYVNDLVYNLKMSDTDLTQILKYGFRSPQANTPEFEAYVNSVNKELGLKRDYEYIMLLTLSDLSLLKVTEYYSEVKNKSKGIYKSRISNSTPLTKNKTSIFNEEVSSDILYTMSTLPISSSSIL